MIGEFLFELVWKSLLVAGATLLLLAAAQRRSAAEKSLIGETGMLSLLLLPATNWLLPRFEFTPPPMVGATVNILQPGPATGEAIAPIASALTLDAVVPWLYAVPAAVLVAGLIVSLMRLVRLCDQAEPVRDPAWLDALAAAERSGAIRAGTSLLASAEIGSPISWGVVRPVIVIDPISRAQHWSAPAILAHELAHVDRLDWLKLVAARMVVAILWFNPLVWLLAARCNHLREEAADDVVLRSHVAEADYAGLLVRAMRCADHHALSATNGVAPSPSAIRKRIKHVLDRSRSRAPARLRWAAASLLLATGINGALAAAEPVRAASAAVDPLSALVRALKDEDASVRQQSLRSLAAQRPAPDPRVVPDVSRLLHDPDPRVRAAAADTIAGFRTVRNSRSIEKMLIRDPAPLVRQRAARALGTISDPDSRSALQAGLADADPTVRAEARSALAKVRKASRQAQRL